MENLRVKPDNFDICRKIDEVVYLIEQKADVNEYEEMNWHNAEEGHQFWDNKISELLRIYREVAF